MNQLRPHLCFLHVAVAARVGAWHILLCPQRQLLGKFGGNPEYPIPASQRRRMRQLVETPILKESEKEKTRHMETWSLTLVDICLKLIDLGPSAFPLALGCNSFLTSPNALIVFLL